MSCLRFHAATLGTWLLFAQPVAAQESGVELNNIEFVGNTKTREQTLEELLPRPIPGRYQEAELEEYERRLANLAIFDFVNVEHRGETLTVIVREKWTLLPIFDFGTGKTLADIYAQLGAAEYNALGTATTVGGYAAYSERRPSGLVYFEQHGYHPRRWALSGEAYYLNSSIRFEDPDASWTRQRIGGSFWWTAPFGYTLPFRYSVGVEVYHEGIRNISGTEGPGTGLSVGSRMVFTWDRMRWHDVAPKGYRIQLTAHPGWFLGTKTPQSRSDAKLQVNGAIRLTPLTVIAMQGKGSLFNRGNPNHSALLGSYSGVRGLPDALFRNWYQAVFNLEVRQAVMLAKRWALQGVLFADAALFEPLTIEGKRSAFRQALSVGGGVRIIPTWLADGLLRLDVARTIPTSSPWFVQFGIAQYF